MLKRLMVAGCLLSLLSGVSGADVRYTLKIKTPGTTVETAMTTWVKGKRERMETTTDMGTMKMTQINLTMCDKHQSAQLDTDLKIYMVTPFAGTTKDGGAAGKGQMIMTYTVKDLGKEKIGKIDAHHWIITTRSQGSGCIGTLDTTSKVEVWTAPIQVLNCPERTTYSQPNCHVTLVEKGDVKGMRAAYSGMIVKMISYNGEAKTSEQVMSDYSTEALSDALFNIPADYKLVTAAEWQTQQQQKMMKMYQPK